MSVETLTRLILNKMPDIGKWQRDFMIHLMPLLLTIRGRHNFENLSRYGSFNEATYRVRYEGGFDFEQFNEELILSLPEEERIIAFDPSYIPKSGKYTPGTGYFWRSAARSGCANSTKYGLEISGFASVGLESRTALHLYARQTIGQDRYDSLLDYYASIVLDQADRLKAVSDIFVADGYFWRRPFVDAVTQAGFRFISKLPGNAVLKYPYLGPKPNRRGRPPKYQGRVDPLNLDSTHFTPCLQEDNLMAYEGKVYVKALDRLVKCVIVHLTKKDGTLRAEAFFSTDPNMDGARVLQCYRLRFQIEFLYRDAKQHTGLTQCQARSESKIHTHVNASLTAVSLAKAAHAWPQAGRPRKPFSLSSIKTQYFNEHLLHRFFCEAGGRPFGMNTETHINSPQYRSLYNYGCIAA